MEREDSLAAHIKDDRIQSVKTHCQNVAEYASIEANKVELSDTLRLTGLLHDIGKNTQVFNNYIHKAVVDSSYMQKVNHSSAGGRYMYEMADATTKMEVVVCQLIAYAIVSHHGLTDIINLDREDCFQKRVYPERDNFYDEVIKNTEFINKDQFRKLFINATVEIESKYRQIVNVKKQMNSSQKVGNFMLGCLQRLILSLLVDADWRDTSEFIDNKKYERISKQEIIKKWNQYQYCLNIYMNSFKQDRGLSKLRGEMSNQCCLFSNNGNGVYRLAIPTGGGKTLASMRYALKLAEAEKKRHIYYIAPYLSILEQNAQLIKNILQDDNYVIEYHSNLIVSENNGQGNRFSEDWSELVILTTLVQFLNTMFSGDMKSIRRFHQLTDSVIILDEAQTIPVKCLNLFTTMINFLSQCCHTTVVICTATQPLFEKIKCPLLYSQPADMILNIGKYLTGFRRTQIINYCNVRMDTDELVSMILNNLNKNMLIILNTKTAVQNLYQKICSRVEERVFVFQLTTYMCAANRLDVIEKIKALLEEKIYKVICISTQLIEAGVDISFETVVRSLTGLDSIAQAAGRCNRNAEKEIGNVYIVDYVEENLSRLKDIRYAQTATRLVMDRFGENLSTQEAMEFYYKQYFFKREGEMNYNIHETNDTLFDLLASNQKHMPSTIDYPMLQAFQTAGKLFNVIEDTEMIGVIVPYKQAKEHIQELRTVQNIKEIKYCLKKLQRYTVNVYKNDKKLNKLIERNAIDCSLLNGAVYILDEAFYDDSCGMNDQLDLIVF